MSNNDYLNIDFDTSKERLKELMKTSETFKDYNYEGSNITMLLELVSFLNDNSTYYMNKLIKNIYPNTTEVYGPMHSISSIRGYDPRGWVAPNLNLKISVLVDSTEESLPSPGDQLFIPAWYKIQTEMTTEDGDPVSYITTDDYTIDIPNDISNGETYSFTIPMKEGDFYTMEYTGEDIIDNKIILPFYDFDYDVLPYDENPSITLFVNNEAWTRVKDFLYTTTDETSQFKLEYDKYQRYNIVFSTKSNITGRDKIKIIANVTNGPEGDIYSNYLTDFEEENEIPLITEEGIVLETQRFVQNISSGVQIPKDYIEIWNPDYSFNSNTPETIDEIRNNSAGTLYSQNRNTTPKDYRIHLVDHPNVIVGNAWGESEIDPQNTEEYNKVYISVIPINFDHTSSTLSLSGNTITWNRSEVGQSSDILEVVEYNESFKNSVLQHLEPRKGISIYETMITPEIVYFAIDIGITTKKSYNFAVVKEEIKKKLNFYFDPKNRSFNETIDFKKIQSFLLDKTVRDFDNKKFTLTNAVDSVVFRDILTYTPSLSGSADTVYEPNEDLNYPMFVDDSYSLDYYNVMRPIKIGLNQFPALAIDNCVFINEN